MNKELITQAREAIDNMDDYARMANIVATGPLLVLSKAIDAWEASERQLDGAALLNGIQGQEIAELTTAIEEADRARMSVLHDLTSAQTKLILARDELLRCKQIMLYECGIGLVNEVVLAQIVGEE